METYRMIYKFMSEFSWISYWSIELRPYMPYPVIWYLDVFESCLMFALNSSCT